MSSILDPLVLFIVFGVLVVASIYSYFVFDMAKDSGLITADQADDFEGFYGAINNFGLFIMIAIIGATIAAAYLIKSNPIFFFIAVFLIFLQALILPQIVNILNGIIDSPNFADAQDSLGNLIWIMQISPVASIFGSLAAAVVGMRAE